MLEAGFINVYDHHRMITKVFSGGKPLVSVKHDEPELGKERRVCHSQSDGYKQNQQGNRVIGSGKPRQTFCQFWGKVRKCATYQILIGIGQRIFPFLLLNTTLCAGHERVIVIDRKSVV